MIFQRDRQHRGSAHAAESLRECEPAVTDVDHCVGDSGPQPERVVGVIQQEHRRTAGCGKRERGHDIPLMRVQDHDVGVVARELAKPGCALQEATLAA